MQDFCKFLDVFIEGFEEQVKNLLVAIETKWRIMENLRSPLCSHGHLLMHASQDLDTCEF